MAKKSERRGGFRFRNALADFQHVPARLVAEGRDSAPALAAVAIPTYRRPDLLFEAVRSVLEQNFDRNFELIVVDNDPKSQLAAVILERLPELQTRNFRYFVNAENVGMFGNFNRCIELARGEWITILNDDDMLEPDYLTTMFASLDRNLGIDGLVSRKRQLDERALKVEAPRSLPRRAAARLLQELQYWGASTRRINPRKLYWWPGGVVGNGAGFIFRTSAARAIGGFYPEEGMAADYWFYGRFAQCFHLRQHRMVGARVRIAANESAKPETLKNFLLMTYTFQQTLLAEGAPRGWGRFSPMIMARQRRFYRDYWGVDIPEEEVERMLNIKLPPDRPILFRLVRLAMRGF